MSYACSLLFINSVYRKTNKCYLFVCVYQNMAKEHQLNAFEFYMLQAHHRLVFTQKQPCLMDAFVDSSIMHSSHLHVLKMLIRVTQGKGYSIAEYWTSYCVSWLASIAANKMMKWDNHIFGLILIFDCKHSTINRSYCFKHEKWADQVDQVEVMLMHIEWVARLLRLLTDFQNSLCFFKTKSK